ncbi:polyprotein [Rice necrosis mosaic virus]|uniref:Polyprotein n=1 Tax=Rice necrosis mosaic virus TaxID=59500 RepID=A0A0P0YQE3_9POTY|nr:polyprotein [Rice necrosis mosaic virus]BAT23038.1 polyprotein [Rice necrosis mosaic virus]
MATPPRVDDFIPEVFYKKQVDKLKELLKAWSSQTTVYHKLAGDRELLAFLMLSRALLNKLSAYLEAEDKRCMVMALNADTVETLAVVRQALIGIKINFGSWPLEQGWMMMMKQLDSCLDESYTENAQSLKKAMQVVGMKLLAAKNRIEICERSVDNYGLNTTCYDRLRDIGSRVRDTILRKPSSNIFPEEIRMSYFRALTTTLHLATQQFFLKALAYLCGIYQPLQWLFNFCVGTYAMCNMFNISWLVVKWSLRTHFGKHWTIYAASFLVCVTTTCFWVLNQREKTYLQSAQKQRKFIGILAFCITVVYMFDVDMADALAANLGKITRLVGMYTDDYNGFANNATTWLQSGINSNQLSGVQNTLAVVLNLDDEDTDGDGTVIESEDQLTFKAWASTNHLAGKQLVRPLQYDVQARYALNSDNVEELSRQMCSERKQWSQVVGYTGSGKSTVLPVAYYNDLKSKIGRQHCILVCEPTQAATVNVVGGISHNLGTLVFGRHEKWENLGDKCIQVMTYGSALASQARDSSFLTTFDAVFLDESHLVTEHSLAFESVCHAFPQVCKFYVSATPRDGKDLPSAKRRFEIKTVTSECNSVDTFITSQTEENSLYVLNHNTVLVFLAGKRECVNAAAKWNKNNLGDMMAYPLSSDNFHTMYSKLIQEMDNNRVIVFCTNILETGVTMNVDCVVDFGWTMRPELDLVTKTLSLRRKRVTKNERAQRVGRAGRLKEGYAIVCGKTDASINAVPPETLYGAALLSFVHGVQFYMNEFFEREWIEGITKAQARVMTQFKLSPFLMRDIVRSDGSIPRAILPCIQNYAHRTCDLKSTKTSVLPMVYNSWPSYTRLLAEVSRGEEKPPSALRRARVPFIISTMTDFDWEKLAHACLYFEPRVISVFSQSDETKRVLNLQLSESGIMSSIEYVKATMNEYKRSISNLQRVIETFEVQTFITKLTRLDPTKRIRERISLYTDNVQTLQQALSKLETLSYSNNCEVSMDKASLDQLTEMVELQCRGVLNRNHVARIFKLSSPPSQLLNLLVEKSKAFIATILMMIAAVSVWLVFKMRSENKKEATHEGENQASDLDHWILEGKGKTYHDRYKRMGFSTEEEVGIYQEFHEATKRNKLTKHSQPERRKSKLRTEKPAFMHFYDLKTDSNVLQAVFKTFSGVIFHVTKNPTADAAKLHEKLEQHLESDVNASSAWGDDETGAITCELTMKDGRKFLINMDRHNPMKPTEMGDEQGFKEFDGHFRQVGSTKLLGQAETSVTHLEAASVKPMTKFSLDTRLMVGIVETPQIKQNVVLYGDWIVSPAHIQVGSGQITFKFIHTTYCTTTDVLNKNGVVRFKGHDLILIRRPNGIPPVRKEIDAAVLTKPTEIQMLFRSLVDLKHKVTVSDMCFQFGRSRWAHTISTDFGMCGGMVFDAASNKFLGVHTSSNPINKRNEFQPFTQEMLDVMNSSGRKVEPGTWEFKKGDCGYEGQPLAILQGKAEDELQQLNDNAAGFGFNLDAQIVRPPTLRSQEIFAREFGLDTTFKLVGQVTKGLIDKHVITGENPYFHKFLEEYPQFKWVQSEMYEYAPSVLAYDAYFKDLRKYDRPHHPKIYDATVLEASKEQLIKMLKLAGLTKTNVRTAEEVLMDTQWSTSAGPLYHGKKLDVVEHLDDEELIKFAETCRQALLDGRLNGIWNGSLKAELRAIEKVEERKTRVFTAAPITSLLAMKFYVDDFNKQFYGTHLKAPHTVGINKFSRGWEKLYNKLNQPGWMHGSGDGSRFDSSIDPFLFDVVLDIRKRFMHEKHHAALHIIYGEIMNTKICLANGLIIQKHCGNNSGQPSTVVDNTLALMTAFLYAYARLTGDVKFEELDKNFIFVCNGDDNKFAISPEFYWKYGCDFSPFLSELGLKYEFDEITDDICLNPYMSLTMTPTKLGIGFSLAPQRIVAIVQWSRAGGVLHAYLAAIAACIESFNTQRLYLAMRAYALYLMDRHKHEIAALAELKGMDAMKLHIMGHAIMHYVEIPDYYQYGDMTTANIVILDDEVPDSENSMTFLQAGPGDGNNLTETENPPKTSDGAIIPKTQATWSLPVIKPKAIGFSTKIPIDLIAQVPEGYVETLSIKATTNQHQKWVQDVRSDLGITDDETWHKVVAAACIFFGDNGTSEDMDEDQVIEVKSGLNSTQELPAKPFIRHARRNATLRKIMRHYSFETKLLFMKMRRIPHWAVKHGCVDEIVFDFMIPDAFTSRQAVEKLKQTKISAIGVGTSNSMLTSETTNLKKTETRRRNDYDGHEGLIH